MQTLRVSLCSLYRRYVCVCVCVCVCALLNMAFHGCACRVVLCVCGTKLRRLETVSDTQPISPHTPHVPLSSFLPLPIPSPPSTCSCGLDCDVAADGETAVEMMRTAHDDANHDGYAFVSLCEREKERGENERG